MSERKPHLDGSAAALLVGSCLLWGLNQVAAKAALPEVPALQQAALRSLGGALLVFGRAAAGRADHAAAADRACRGGARDRARQPRAGTRVR